MNFEVGGVRNHVYSCGLTLIMSRGVISSLFRMQSVSSAKRFCSSHQSINNVKRIAVEGNIGVLNFYYNLVSVFSVSHWEIDIS